MAHVLAFIANALNAVEAEQEKHNAGRGSVSNGQQLELIRSKLLTMSTQISSGDVPPKEERIRGIGRMVTDSWPLNNELGEVLIEAEQRYLKY